MKYAPPEHAYRTEAGAGEQRRGERAARSRPARSAKYNPRNPKPDVP